MKTRQTIAQKAADLFTFASAGYDPIWIVPGLSFVEEGDNATATLNEKVNGQWVKTRIMVSSDKRLVAAVKLSKKR